MSLTHRSGFRAAAPAIAAALVGMLLSSTAVPEHEVDHRYTILGRVLDANGDPVSGQTVTVSGAAGGSATTDREGNYRIRLHLHDEDLGKKLRLSSANAAATVVVRFQPGNASTPRLHQVDLVGGEFVEQEPGRLPVGGWVYVVAALALVTAAIWVTRTLRRRSRRGAASESSRPGKKKRRPRKGRRR